MDLTTGRQRAHHADALEAADIDSPFAIDTHALEAWRQANPGATVNESDHRMTDRLRLDLTQLPAEWRTHVYDLMVQRRTAKHQAKADAAIQDLPEAVRTLARSRRGNRTFIATARDLRYLLTMNNRDGNRVNSVYKPDPRCTLRLKLSDAIQIDYEQASYADHSRYVIPVEGECPTDLSPCVANFTQFCKAICTHNGFAGSGSSWTMELIKTPAGPVVYADCRESISD